LQKQISSEGGRFGSSAFKLNVYKIL